MFTYFLCVYVHKCVHVNLNMYEHTLYTCTVDVHVYVHVNIHVPAHVLEMLIALLIMGISK
jgi:hypothetical protein